MKASHLTEIQWRRTELFSMRLPARFVVPLRATVNMDGGTIYFPCACIWLAVLNGIEPNVTSCFLLAIIATIRLVNRSSATLRPALALAMIAFTAESRPK